MRLHSSLTKTAVYLLAAIWLATCLMPEGARASDLSRIENLIGTSDAIMVTDPGGRVLITKNPDKTLIPASTLKLLTSLVALHHLGADYRFPTEFYTDADGRLKIKGYGDPLLISEVVADIAGRLAEKVGTIRALVLDDSQFTQPLVIPGVSSSAEPFDAPNGALCVNFNTVNFKTENGVYVSAEPQTPLLPMVLKRVQESNLAEGRIVLSHQHNQCTLYAGQLFRHYLIQAGVTVGDVVELGRVDPQQDTLVYRHLSPFSVEEVIRKLLEHSNNFTTNQLLIAAGVAVSGPPGNLSKGVAAANAYAHDVLGLKETVITEGSGISRSNRTSARDLQRVLEAFYPHHHLMRQQGRVFYKTGTLQGISTRAGYIERADGDFNRFVVLVNTPGKSTNRIMRKLLKSLD
jgi:D-alanyl-D-alanine carboxypeptidase/D-alanyl-D-alanine-endopeptidase (penicillin-binding protein 4)